MSQWPDSHIRYSHKEFKEHGEYHKPGWYFYDEAGYIHGPYKDKDETIDMMDKYIKEVLGEK